MNNEHKICIDDIKRKWYLMKDKLIKLHNNNHYGFHSNPKFIKYNLNLLPKQLYNKIYILCMRKYWRNYIPLTAQVPSWTKSAIQQRNLIYESMQKNIHFLHLPCNTLEEYKKYIPGCQCHYCQNRLNEFKLNEFKLNEEYDKENSIIYDVIYNYNDFTYQKYNNYIPKSSYILSHTYIFDEDYNIFNIGMQRFNFQYDFPDSISIHKLIISDIRLGFNH